jgi:diguanylate cyclase (GGDEF)-like protein/PAS domain S-box-containing protein
MTPPPPYPPNESRRIARLHGLAVLDTGAEPLFDALARAAALVAGTPIGMITLVDTHRQWFKANHGLPGVRETPREVAFCAHTILEDGLLEIPDARKDDRFANNPLVTGSPAIRFYAGAPLTLHDGLRMGALCVIDREPRDLDDRQRAILKELAHVVSEALDQRALAIDRNAALQREADAGERLAQIIDGTSAGIWRWNVQTGEIELDGRWVDLIGYLPVEMAPYTTVGLPTLSGPSAWQRLVERARRQAASGSDDFDAELQLRHKNGHDVWVLLRGRITSLGLGGQPHWVQGTAIDITARKSAETRLRASEAFLDRTGRMAAVGGWEMDLETYKMTWSDATCRIHGVAEGYAPSLREGLAFYAPEARPVIEAAFTRAISDGSNWDLELPFVTADGRHIWVRTFGSVEYEGDRARRLVGALQDITMRKQAIEALAESEQRFRRLFQNSLGLICTHDLDGVILSINLAAARTLGYRVAEMMGRPLAEFMRSELLVAFAQYLDRVRSNGEDSGVLELLSKDGTRHTWQYNNMLDTTGPETYVLGHAQDITERRDLERRLRESAIRDPLTGCFNRRFLAEIEADSRQRIAWGCIAIDLDRFKQVNDTYGHQRGDEVLVAMAQFLRSHVRPDDAVVRMGGDEFLVMLRDADAAATHAIATRLLEDRDQAPIGFTIGQGLRHAGNTLEDAIAEADRKLYEVRAQRPAYSRHGG